MIIKLDSKELCFFIVIYIHVCVCMYSYNIQALQTAALRGS